jgi:hypothetical protein
VEGDGGGHDQNSDWTCGGFLQGCVTRGTLGNFVFVAGSALGSWSTLYL